MKIRVLPQGDNVAPKFQVIAENTADEVFLKQLTGQYGDADLFLSEVVFNDDGVASLVVTSDGIAGVIAACNACISTDENNALIEGSDGKLFVPQSGGGGTTHILVPNYLTYPNLDPVNPQSVADGDIVIHGGFQWQNTSGGAVVPTVVDEFTLTGLDQMSRTLANNYFPFNAYVETAAAVGEPNMITRIRVPIINHLFELGFVTQNSSYLDPLTTMIGHVPAGNISLAFDAGLGQPTGIISNNLGAMVQVHEAEIKLNGGGGNLEGVNGFASIIGNVLAGEFRRVIGGRFIDNQVLQNGRIERITANSNFLMEGNIITNGAIDGISAIAGESEMKGNELNHPNAAIGSMKFNYGRVNNNQILNKGGIAFCELNDNSEVAGNQLTGFEAFIWDVDALENSEVNGNVLSGDQSRISAIKQNNFDYILNNQLPGQGVNIANIFMVGGISAMQKNVIQNCILQVGEILNGNMGNSRVDNLQFLTRGSLISFFLRGSVIENATDINIRRIELSGARWDLAGYTTDILHHKYNSGKGHFSFDTKDLSQGLQPKPTNEDVPVPYNIIPKGHRVTRVYLQGDGLTGGAGAHLEISCDGEVIADHTLATYNSADGVVAPNGGPFTIGKVLTANSPIELTARNNDITGGDFVLVVEYVKGE